MGLHPFRHINPGVGGETDLKIDSRDVALTTVFAALYAVLVLFLSSLSFGLAQVRIADALIPLSVIFGWPGVMGVTLGCLIGNVVTPMPSIITDMSLGALANFVASILAWKIAAQKRGSMISEFLGCTMATIVITLIVGTYLAILTEMELWIWWLGIFTGSLISINLIGYLTLQFMKKAGLKASYMKRSSFVNPIISSKSKPKASNT